MYTGLFHTHRLLAWLLLFSTTLSMTIAVLNALLGTRPRLVKAGIVLHRRFEVALGGLLLVLGVVMWVALPWPIDVWWLWAGVVAVIGQGAIIARGIKPTLAQLMQGEDKGWLWAGQAVMLWLWITGIFYLMQIN